MWWCAPIRPKILNCSIQLGAKEVVQPEFETSLELSAHLLTRLGLPLPIIQREMQLIRTAHYQELRTERPAYQVSRELKEATQEMGNQWYPLPTESPLIGMTLEETTLRRLTGISLMAIQREDGEEVDYPDAKTMLKPGDRLLVVGEPEELAAFDELANGKAMVPTENASCQWLLLPETSPIVGKTLAEVHIRRQFGVLVQAIRREGRFIGFPDGNSDLQAGDRLLLCGNLYSLNQASRWMSPPQTAPLVPLPMISVSDAIATMQDELSTGV
jgi:CPA2 family monovalent cation:H+ antiporter-2